MAATIPFHRETFRPICIQGNDTADNPVEFKISAVGGQGRARIKSILVASEGMLGDAGWSPAVQEAVIKAFETGAPAFAEGVQEVRGLTVPAALAQKVGLLAPGKLPQGLDEASQVPILTGSEFAAISGYWPVLAFEVAMAIARVSGQAEIDPRFFAWLSTSLGMQPTARGTANNARQRRERSGTAGSRTRKASRQRRT